MATPYERVKAAWDSPDRDGELNRAVETMAAEGFTRDELVAALVLLLSEVRAGGADDETEEIINCVGDRLYGWGRAEWHIHTRAEAVTPSAAANGLLDTSLTSITPKESV